ncbi:hypothetical protein GGR52DRAFT_131730 [Hypoxylon sp. FL1284]|nr:hypothetical protein GGR52DRAFT_131730 [Hypoxylon sp. FL1284]
MSSPAASKSQSQPKKPKGILKKPSASTSALTPDPISAMAAAAAATLGPVTPFPIQETTAAKPSARDVAIQQALVIHQQQALEDEIQESVLALSYFPLARKPADEQGGGSETCCYDAASPAASDADAFRAHVRAFQPGDYEDMVEERNTRGLCGYALCGRPRLRLGRGGAYKLVGYGRADFGIVPRKELERWCSRACARRAMYVKVQLAETPAWERAAMPSFRLELLDEPSAPETAGEGGDDAAARLAREIQNLQIDRERKATQDAAALAFERGDVKDIQSTRLVDVDITEKSSPMVVREPSPSKDNEAHLIVDGYKTKFDSRSETVSESSTIAEVASKINSLSIE